MVFLRPLSSYFLTILTLTSLTNASLILFRGGTIITFNETLEELEIVRNGSLLIKDDRVAGIWASGERPLVSNNTEDVEVIDATGKIITPGFVDTHRHGWQTLFKTLMSNINLIDYFGRFGEYFSAGRLSSEQVYISQLAGLYEALNVGVTTSLDHAHHTWSKDTSLAGLNASIDSGARVFWAYAFRNVTNYTVSEQLINFRAIAESAPHKDTPVSLGVACDFFGNSDFVNDANSVFNLAQEFNVSVITTHTVGGAYGYSNDPSALHKLGLLNTSIPVVFSHATYMAYDEIALLRDTNQFVSVTPESEMHLGLEHPHTAFHLDQAALGVDTHAVFSTDLVTQARMLLQTTRAKLYNMVLQAWQIPSTNPMSVTQVFLLATRNGGLALRRPDLGVLSAGAKADVVVWDGTSPGMLGWADPVAAVMLHSNGGDVEHVLVDGKFVKRDFCLVDKTYSKVQARFLETAKWAQDTWHGIPYPERLKFYATGAPLTETIQVDMLRGEGTGYGELYK